MRKLISHFVRFIVDILLLSKPKVTGPATTLVIKDDAIGDFLVSTGVLKTLTAHFSKTSTVYLLVDKKVANLAEVFFKPENLITIDKELFESSLRYRLSFFRSLYKMNIQTFVASSTRSSYCDQVASRLTCETKWALDGKTKRQKQRSQIYSHLIETKEIKSPLENLPVEALEKEILLCENVLAKKLSSTDYFPYLPKESLNPIADKNYFVLLPDAGDSRRVWNRDEFYAWALTQAKKRNLKCVVLSLHADPHPLLKNPEFDNQTGKTSLRQSLSLLNSAKFVVAHETGLGHATWMMGTPLVMIMGGGYFKEFAPQAKNLKTVFTEMPCFNCHWNCIYPVKDKFPCVEKLQIADVEKAANEVAAL